MLNIKAILSIYNSRRDRYGNVYWAVRLTTDDIGTSVVGTISADNVDTWECREMLHWHIERAELPIREFNKLTKNWDYLGCRWDDIKKCLLTKMAST